MATTLPPFTLLAKPSGAACNLACQYCFYLGKDQLYPGSHMRMSDEVLEAYIEQLLASSRDAEISVAWQGGEPTLMGLDFYQRSVELVKKYKKPGQQAAYSLQTNGTLLDDAWCKFFIKHNFLIGLSMDGPPELHNIYRVNKGGQGSFDQVKRAWDLLQSHGVDTNILCVVHAANADHPLEVYRFFRDELHSGFIQFIPVVERLIPRLRVKETKDLQETAGANHSSDNRESESESVSPRSVKPDRFGSFLIDIFEEWVHHDIGTLFVQTFEAALASWCHLPASICIFQEVCGTALILEHNGDLYACDHFVEEDHRLGNILDKPLAELVQSPMQRRFGLAKRTSLPASCRNCDVLFACHGECPRNRFMTSPDSIEKGLNYLCAGYKMFFHHVDRPMRIMAESLRNGRSAADIMLLHS